MYVSFPFTAPSKEEMAIVRDFSTFVQLNYTDLSDPRFDWEISQHQTRALEAANEAVQQVAQIVREDSKILKKAEEKRTRRKRSLIGRFVSWLLGNSAVVFPALAVQFVILATRKYLTEGKASVPVLLQSGPGPRG